MSLNQLRSLRVGTDGIQYIDARSSGAYSTIALFDIILGIIGLILLALTGIFGDHIKDNAIAFGIIGVFPVGIFFHWVFGVSTPVTRFLAGS